MQASIHFWLEQRSEKADYASQALQLLAEVFPNGEHEHKEMYGSMLAHAQAVLCYDCTSADDIRHRTALLYNVGLVNWRQGRYAPAYREVSEAYNINQKISGEVAANIFERLGWLAWVLLAQVKYEAAEEMHRQVLEGREKVLGVEHPETLFSVYCPDYLFHYYATTVQRCVRSLSQSFSRVLEDVGPRPSYHTKVLPALRVHCH